MKWIIRIFNIKWIFWIFKKIKSRFSIKEVIFTSREVTKFIGINLNEKIIYYNKNIGLAKFLCPCGCKRKESIEIASKVDVKNKIWVLEINKEIPTLFESFWTAGPCDSHYFIKKGVVQFV